MRYKNIYIEDVEDYLPNKVITSEEIEDQLSDIYKQFSFNKGKLEFFTGIKERKYWDQKNIRPSDVAYLAAKSCLQKNNIKANEVDMLIFCSVCRDFLEPSSSSIVHKKLNLSTDCINFDITNACLGMLSGIETACWAINNKKIKRVLLVSGEIGLDLLNQTINTLKTINVNKKEFKNYFASLTIGSGASAMLITHKSKLKQKFLEINSISNEVDTQASDLCQGNYTENSKPLMITDSEKLLNKGLAVARKCWQKLLDTCHWGQEQFNKIYHHQVGHIHTKKLYQELNIDQTKTYETFPFLGNCGSSSLPITLSLAKKNGHLQKKDKIALLGIGSGINCTMLSLKW